MGSLNAVAVVLVTYNSAGVVRDLLASLPAGMAGVDRWQLVVVDNASRDDSLAIVGAERPDATIVTTGANLGYAAAINLGIRAAAPFRAVLVLNPDLRLLAGCAASLLRALDIDRTGVVAPRLLNADGSTAASLRRDSSVGRAIGGAVLGGRLAGRWPALGETVSDPAAYEAPHEVEWATGAALLVSRECLERVGPWDESFFLYSEETDFQLRARDVGFIVRYAPDAVCVHLAGESHASARLWSILTLNRVRLFARRHGRLQRAGFAAAVILNEALRALGGSDTHRAAFSALVRPSRRPREVGRRDPGPCPARAIGSVARPASASAGRRRGGLRRRAP